MFKRFIFILIVVFTTVKTFAQNGLGDPIINVDFGAGAALHGPELPGIIGGKSPYAFTNADVPPIGSYTIINNTNVAPSIWLPTKDHTPDAADNGYMLIVKTRTSGFEVLFEHVLNNLCIGTEYEFAAFVANLARNSGGNAPTLRLRVETNTNPRVAIRSDEIIGPITQGSAAWVHLITGFTNTTSSIVVSIISETPGGASTDDIAIDDVTVNAKGQRIDANFNGGNQIYREVCADAPTTYAATATTPINSNSIKWQRKIEGGVWIDIPGATTTNLTFTTEAVPGTYRYRASSAPPANIAKFECSVVSNELTVWVKPVVTASAGPQKFHLRGGAPVTLQGSSNSGSFFWTVESGSDISSLSSTTILNPLASPTENTVYVLHASGDANTCGPDVISKVLVSVADDVNLPNTFTPNGDGINDKWVIGGITSYQNPVVQVYDRNGQLVFKSLGGSTPWDGTYKGKEVPAGNYYYIVDLNLNGMKFTGSVTVIR